MKRYKTGTYAWAKNTDTSINFQEKVLLIGQLAASQLLDGINWLANKSGINNAKLARVNSSSRICAVISLNNSLIYDIR